MIARFLATAISQEWVESIGWVLVHFVWQATLIGVSTMLVLRVGRAASAQFRYAVSCAGLFLIAVTPIATMALLSQVAPAQVATLQVPDAAAPAVLPPAAPDPRPGSTGPTTSLPVTEERIAAPSENRVHRASSWGTVVWRSITNWIRLWVPYGVYGWLAGVSLLGFRLFVGIDRVRRWRTAGLPIADRELTLALQRVKKRLNIACSIPLLKSEHLSVPAVIGWLRPVVLLPAVAITGLTPSEIESVLAHELAHIRRHDYLISLFQSVIETVWFFHPMVWWVSQSVRVEREYCCDDIAVRGNGGPVALARALAKLEQMRCGNGRLLPAANGGCLLARIRRISKGHAPHASSRWPAGGIALLLVVVTLAGVYMSSLVASPVGARQSPLEDQGEDHDTGSRQYAIEKREVQKTDSRTGRKLRVLPGIRLSGLAEPNTTTRRTVELDMLYSNVISYTFIPDRVAKLLGATELGTIDFGKDERQRPRPVQSMVLPGGTNGKKPLKDESATVEKGHMKEFTVNQLTGPLKGDQKIIAYKNDAVWVPGHLAFYGVNKSKQHAFKVVRIAGVDLGIGLRFGPVNALVLDDENSDFGVLGSDWAAHVRGDKGEILWHSAIGKFFLRSPAVSRKSGKRTKNASPTPKRGKPGPTRSGPATRLESSGQMSVEPSTARGKLTLVKTRSYTATVRKSNAWIRLDSGRVPVDQGIEHDGVTICLSLFDDVIAVDSKSHRVLWHIPWKKTQPSWQTVSIVQYSIQGNEYLAVELFAAQSAKHELVYRYYDLKTGKRLESPR